MQRRRRSPSVTQVAAEHPRAAVAAALASPFVLLALGAAGWLLVKAAVLAAAILLALAGWL